MIKTTGTYVRTDKSQKTGKEYALFICGILRFDVFIDVDYINKDIELTKGREYLIDIQPFYSDSQDRCFMGYKVISEFYDK